MVSILGGFFVPLFNCWIVLYNTSIMHGNHLLSGYLFSFSQILLISLLGVCTMLYQSMLKIIPGTF